MKCLLAWLLLAGICFGGVREQMTKIAVPRSTGSEGNNQVAKYIKTEIGGEFQPFTYRGQATKNVYSKLAGSVSGEIVIVAHYDGMPGIAAADDNASGTVAVLELQKRIKTARHSIVFLFVSGEEQGLIGSTYYVKQSTKPIFALNLDMIGHLKSVVTYDQRPTIETQITKAMSKYPWAKAVTLRDRDADSDHAPFFAVGVPVIFLHTGLHKYYHKASDTPDTLNYAGMEQIIQYAEELIRAIDSYDMPDYNLLTDLQIYEGHR